MKREKSWVKIIDELECSGLGVRAFAEREGYCQNRLYYHRKKQRTQKNTPNSMSLKLKKPTRNKHRHLPWLSPEPGLSTFTPDGREGKLSNLFLPSPSPSLLTIRVRYYRWKNGVCAVLKTHLTYSRDCQLEITYINHADRP